MGTIIFADQMEIPLEIGNFAAFRRWSRSKDFPAEGRIDFVAGQIEVDVSPENIFYHGSPKSEIHYGIVHRVKELQFGRVFVDSTRIVNENADLSAEPDVVVVAHDSIASGRVRMVPTTSGDADSFAEIDGAPDLVVEVVSDASVKKDTERLPKAYFRAGVREYWVVDARGKELVFQIYHRGAAKYHFAQADDTGFQESVVLACWYRLDRRRARDGFWDFELVPRS